MLVKIDGYATSISALPDSIISKASCGLFGTLSLGRIDIRPQYEGQNSEKIKPPAYSITHYYHFCSKL
jgi:hypothetical protein